MARTSFFELGLFGPTLLFTALLPACSNTPAPFPAPSSGNPATANPCESATTPCTAFDPTTSTEAEIQEALVAAQENQTFFFKEGVYRFANTISVATPGVTLQGAGKGKTILDFTDQ